MDLALTRRGDYAVRAALCLAHAWGSEGYLKIREIAGAMDLPANYMPQVLKLLATASLVEARAGREGGYRLRSAPREITLLAVVEAAEGPLALERCIIRGAPCHWEHACALHGAWSAAVNASREALERTTLADLVVADEQIRAGAAPPPGLLHRQQRQRQRRP